MVPNARLTSYREQINQTGRGVPVHGVNRLASPVPCEALSPSSFKVDQAAQRGERLDRILKINGHCFVVAGRRPQPGDRLTLELQQLMSSPVTGDILSVKEEVYGMLEITVGQRGVNS